MLNTLYVTNIELYYFSLLNILSYGVTPLLDIYLAANILLYKEYFDKHLAILLLNIFK